MARPLKSKELEFIRPLLDSDPKRWLYAADIAKLSSRGISERAIPEIGRRLAKLGLVDSMDQPWGEEKRKRASYRVSGSAAQFARLALSILEGEEEILAGREFAEAGLRFLSTDVARRALTPDLVRGILCDRRVEMRRTARLDQRGSLASDDDYDASPHSVRLPVAPSEAEVKITMERAIDGLEDPARPGRMEALADFVRNHYAKEEAERLITPMLALIQVSQGALREFVGSWERDAHPQDKPMSFNARGIQMVEPLLFRMIYAAVSDLATARAIPKKRAVTWATVCPQLVPVRKDFPRALLELQWKEEATIGYWAGFVAQVPFTTSFVETWWRDQAINGPPPPAWR